MGCTLKVDDEDVDEDNGANQSPTADIKVALTGSEQGLSSTRRSSSTCMTRKGLASTGVSCLAHHG